MPGRGGAQAGTNPTGAATGDLAGVYPGPRVAALTTSDLVQLLFGLIADGKFLKRVGTTIVGADVIPTISLVTKTFADTPYAAVLGDVVLFDASGGSSIITLPDAAISQGSTIYIKKIDSSSNSITIDPFSTQTLDGALGYVFTTQYESIEVVSDGANWFIIG